MASTLSFPRGSRAYSSGVKGVISRKTLMMGVYLLLVGATVFFFKAVPPGFVPPQDKQYLVGFTQLPDGASLDRTEEVIRRISDISLKVPGVESAIAFPGLSINGFTNSSNAGIVFLSLKPFEERTTPDLSAGAIAGRLNQELGVIKESFSAIFPPPPVQGLGAIGGFKLQLEDKAGLGYEALDAAVKGFMAKAYTTPELVGMFSSYQVNVPQLYADVDRAKARQLNVPLTEIFNTLQIYLGSVYVNDFNKFGRTYSVRVQADANYRAQAEDIGKLEVRSSSGEMIPLSAVLNVTSSAGPERAMRYNGLPRRRYQRKYGTRLFVRPGPCCHRTDRGGNTPRWRDVRMDRADLSGDHCRQYRYPDLPVVDPARLPGAGSPV